MLVEHRRDGQTAETLSSQAIPPGVPRRSGEGNREGPATSGAAETALPEILNRLPGWKSSGEAKRGTACRSTPFYIW